MKKQYSISRYVFVFMILEQIGRIGWSYGNVPASLGLIVVIILKTLMAVEIINVLIEDMDK